jgi:thioredoxin-dependent peroxiredoxin
MPVRDRPLASASDPTEEAALIEEGKPAPDFELETDSGETVKLSDFRGRPVVLYFYPKDDTPGCTTEACEFRDAYDVYRERGAEVLGVSPDDVASHGKFKSKHELPFTLLADPDHSVAEQYGVWGERKFAGKTYMGINRSTFVIDSDGNVAHAMLGIKPAGHAQDVLDKLPA